MRSPRVYLVLLVPTLVWVGGASWKGASVGVKMELALPFRTQIRSKSVAKHQGAQSIQSDRIVEFLTPSTVSGGTSATKRICELAPEGAAVVAETATLQLLAQNTDLDLNGRQWSALAGVTLQVQAIRHAYEASIASAFAEEAGRCRIEIPAYAAAGDALRMKFHALLREELGRENAEEILARMGSELEGHFAGFGVSVQTLDVVGNPRSLASDYAVTRTVKFWNSVEGQERLTTRRETHFPGLEDPTGQTWGPVLSLLPRIERAGS